jgi:hypothetical protein
MVMRVYLYLTIFNWLNQAVKWFFVYSAQAVSAAPNRVHDKYIALDALLVESFIDLVV